jgi:type VI secretion system protein ImpH
MASPSGRKKTSLIEMLSEEAYRFEFFQAVRLLRLLAMERQVGPSGEELGVETWESDPERGEGQLLSAEVADATDPPRSPEGSRTSGGPRRPAYSSPVGEDHSPQDEIVRFRTHVSHSFPPGEIVSFRQPDKLGESKVGRPPEMVISFLGLVGPQGVLPRHYTQLVIDRVRRKDHALRDFLDIFHHRLISLFYRAWEKYRVAIGYERAHYRTAEDSDLFLECLYAIVGLRTGHQRGRLRLSDEVFLHYGGLFAHAPRNAVSLEQMLGDHFEIPVRIEQFQGEWLYLRREDQTRMPNARDPEGRNNQLGMTALVGDRVWGVENRFRVRLGPLRYSQFLQFTPDGDRLVPICQLTRMFVGADMDFDIQPVLRAEETPECQLVAEGEVVPKLGWNTWLRGDPMARDPDDAHFCHSGNPE